MYQEFYNFSAEPFRLSPDHGFVYAHKGYKKARAYMAYALKRAEGFVMITGRPGTGKTTLIGALLGELTNSSVNIANLVCTQLQADDLLKMVAYEFGIPVSVVEKGELLQHLTLQLKSWHRDGRRALLIVDEAQDLSVSAMEELRLLTNIQVGSRPLLQIFLLGQPELRELILSPRLEQVHQRIIAASHLRPLESHETEAYIRHRLEAVHWQGNPAISKAVYPLVYKFSEGVPRRINLICSRLLLHCAVEERQRVAVSDVREVVQELQDENLASGDSFAESDFLVSDVFDEDIHEGNDPGKEAKLTSRIRVIAKAKQLNNREQVIKTASGSGRSVEPENRVEAAGSVHQGYDTEQQVAEAIPQRKVNGSAGQAVPIQYEAGWVTVNPGRPRLPTESATARDQVQSKPAQATPRTREKNERLKSVKFRARHTAKTTGKTKPADTASERDEKNNMPHLVVNADQEESRGVDSGPGGRASGGSPLWPVIALLLVTFVLIFYGTWLLRDQFGWLAFFIVESINNLEPPINWSHLNLEHQ